MSESLPIKLTVNGEERPVFVRAWDTLLHVLRDEFRLTGTKRGCNQGVCGACSVMVDGEVVRGCLSLAANCTGAEITTIEGLAQGDTLTPVQQAFLDEGAVQCGFCTPGVLMSAQAVLNANDHPDEEAINDGMAGVLCRCTGHIKVKEAIRHVGAGEDD